MSNFTKFICFSEQPHSAVESPPPQGVGLAELHDGILGMSRCRVENSTVLRRHVEAFGELSQVDGGLPPVLVHDAISSPWLECLQMLTTHLQ